MPDEPFFTEPVPFEDAARLISRKPVMSREVFDALMPELQASAFVISKVEDLDVVRRVKDRIAELPLGSNWRAIKRDLVKELSPFLDTEDDPDGAVRRAELLLRAHGFAAYSAANWKTLEENADIFPWRKYQTAQDERVRGSHAALDGLILPASSPFWLTHTPPWDFGCRCDVVGMTDEEVQSLLETDRRRSVAERQVYEPGSAELGSLETRGRIIRRARTESGGWGEQEVNVARDPRGFSFRPGDVSLLRNPALLEERWGADLFGAFREWAMATVIEGLGTVWDWINGTAK